MIQRRIIGKRVVALTVAFGLAGFGLAGCSSDEKKDEPKKDKEETTKMEEGSDAPAEPVEIEYWHRLPDKEEMIKVSESAEAFTKENPEIKVKTVKFEGDATDSYNKITAAITAGNAPCLAQASYDGIPAMLVRDELMDVTSEVEEYKDNYAAGPWGQTSPGGNTYGLPQDTGPLVYYYDKDAFAELGIEAPTTWDEYWENAAKAKAAGKTTSVFFKDETGDWFGGIEAANNNSWFAVNDDSWQVTVNDDSSKKVAEAWQKSIDEGTTMVADRWDENGDFAKGLKEGNMIGYIGAGWEAAFNLGDLGKEEANWQVAQMPDNVSGPWGGSAVVVLKGCEHPEQALKFANWYNTNMEAMTSQGLVPAATGKAPTPEAIEKLYGGQDVMAELQKAAEIANPNWAFSPTWPAVKKTLIDNAGAGMDLGENLDKAQDEAVNTLEAEGIPVK